MIKEPLTQREEEIMELLIEGQSNPEISKKLFISVHTVKAHIESIYYKLNVSNRVQAAVKYLRMKRYID